MRVKFVSMSLLAAAVASGVVAQVPKPTKEPVSLSPAQRAKYQDALALKAAGRYVDAAKALEEVVSENPDSPQALAEEARCWNEAKEYEKALDPALRGMEYSSQWLGTFYVLAAESYYLTGRAAQALPFFQAATAREPDNWATYYKLGVTYAGLKRIEEAREALKAAVALAPDRADAHYALGVLWSAQGYKVPALLALSRFLVLEPETERAKGALKAVSDYLDEMGGTFGAAGPLRSAPDNAEGDFTAAIGAVATAWKAAQEDQGADNWSRVTRSVATLFARLSQPDSAWTGSFTASFYAPYFSAIAAQKLTDPFCAHIFRVANNDLVKAYIETHSAEIYEFLKWSDGYRWPRPDTLVKPPAKPAVPARGKAKGKR